MMSQEPEIRKRNLFNRSKKDHSLLIHQKDDLLMLIITNQYSEDIIGIFKLSSFKENSMVHRRATYLDQR